MEGRGQREEGGQRMEEKEGRMEEGGGRRHEGGGRREEGEGRTALDRQLMKCGTAMCRAEEWSCISPLTGPHPVRSHARRSSENTFAGVRGDCSTNLHHFYVKVDILKWEAVSHSSYEHWP